MGMKPDRLERAVDAIIDQAEDSYLHHDVLALLRREQRAQRARVVRIVKDELAYRIKRHRDPSEDVSAVAACKSILAKLHGRTP